MQVIVFGAHPDDIEIGMGGTIAKYISLGHKVLAAVVTVPYGKDSRIDEAKRGAEILGCDIEVLDLDTSVLCQPRLLVKEFDNLINLLSPDVVFGHWNHDSHQDHVCIANAILAATRKNNCSVYMYEQTIPGGIVPYGFKAQAYVDITDFIELKVEATKMHKTPIGDGMSDLIEGLKGRSSYRGRQINVKYAESFELVKEINII